MTKLRTSRLRFIFSLQDRDQGVIYRFGSFLLPMIHAIIFIVQSNLLVHFNFKVLYDDRRE